MVELMEIAKELQQNADEVNAIGGMASIIRDWVDDGYLKSRVIEEIEGISASCEEIAGRLRKIAGEVGSE